MKTTNLALFSAVALVAVSVAGARPAAEKGFDDPARLSRLIREGKPVYLLVDVRTQAEYESGHIPTAIDVPVDVIGTQPPSKDKAVLIIVYCRSGNRSAAARRTLVALGYTNVVDFGAVSRWEGMLVTGKDPGKAR
jgi:rhodanese-related sulfurtransferase